MGTISANGEREIGELIAKAMEKVGKEGVITIQVSLLSFHYLFVILMTNFRGIWTEFFCRWNILLLLCLCAVMYESISSEIGEREKNIVLIEILLNYALLLTLMFIIILLISYNHKTYSNNLILGAVGLLQFDVVAYRLKHEYNVDCIYESVSVVTARWIQCDDTKKLEEFKAKAFDHLALDGSDHLTYLAPTRVNLHLMMERWPYVQFKTTREH